MPLEQDVLDIGKQLEKLVAEGQSDNETATDLLNRLKELPITLDILQKTRIGMAVNVVRKASTKEDIQIIAKSLIKSWKKLLDTQDKATKVQRQSSQEKTSDSPSSFNRSSSLNLHRSDSNSSSSSASNNKTSNEQASKSFPPSRGTSDPVRNRCTDMIANSLKCEERPDFDVSKIAQAIEDEIFRLFKDTGSKYKNRVKSRVLNLRDKRNVQLRLLVIDGEITPQKFASMVAEEMACDALKKERDEITQQAIKDHQLATTTGTATGQFKCNRCGKRKTTYSQVQTRSADEPMTTFVYCIECGNRWKFC